MAAFIPVSGIVRALPADSIWIAMLVAIAFAIVEVSLLRVGLLAAATALYTSGLFLMFPMPIDLDAWYAGAGVSAMLAFAVLTLFGFVTALGGRSPFGRAVAAP